MGAFIGGLRADLAVEVRVYRPKIYGKATDIVCLWEDHINATKKANRQEPRRIGTNLNEYRGGGILNKREQLISNPRTIPQGVKRLPWDELQKRREKGLCFNCDEKFVPGHKCKVKQTFLIEPVESDDEQELENPTEAEFTEISISVMADVHGPQTLRMGSRIKGRRIIVLIDNGSTHNFINQDVARRLQLKATTVEPFDIRVANGE